MRFGVLKPARYSMQGPQIINKNHQQHGQCPENINRGNPGFHLLFNVFIRSNSVLKHAPEVLLLISGLSYSLKNCSGDDQTVWIMPAKRSFISGVEFWRNLTMSSACRTATAGSLQGQVATVNPFIAK